MTDYKYVGLWPNKFYIIDMDGEIVLRSHQNKEIVERLLVNCLKENPDAHIVTGADLAKLDARTHYLCDSGQLYCYNDWIKACEENETIYCGVHTEIIKLAKEACASFS